MYNSLNMRIIASKGIKSYMIDRFTGLSNHVFFYYYTPGLQVWRQINNGTIQISNHYEFNKKRIFPDSYNLFQPSHVTWPSTAGPSHQTARAAAPLDSSMLISSSGEDTDSWSSRSDNKTIRDLHPTPPHHPYTALQIH